MKPTGQSTSYTNSIDSTSYKQAAATKWNKKHNVVEISLETKRSKQQTHSIKARSGNIAKLLEGLMISMIPKCKQL